MSSLFTMGPPRDTPAHPVLCPTRRPTKSVLVMDEIARPNVYPLGSVKAWNVRDDLGSVYDEVDCALATSANAFEKISDNFMLRRDVGETFGQVFEQR